MLLETVPMLVLVLVPVLVPVLVLVVPPLDVTVVYDCPSGAYRHLLHSGAGFTGQSIDLMKEGRLAWLPAPSSASAAVDRRRRRWRRRLLCCPTQNSTLLFIDQEKWKCKTAVDSSSSPTPKPTPLPPTPKTRHCLSACAIRHPTSQTLEINHRRGEAFRRRRHRHS